MSLEYWQNRLHRHFTVLSTERSSQGHPVFAVEHGLNEKERQQLAEDVRAVISARPPSDAYWLPWVVYATEIGYAYDGEEYWQTYKQITPGWTAHLSRPDCWLRELFVRFHKAYRGLKPSGQWARSFPIIAWPIQHAILPQYLQYHLAKLLHELRFDLTAHLLADPASLGEYLHAESHRSVKRLQEFAEEHILIGTIAAALLRSCNEHTHVSLLPVTFQRLITDLEREQRAKNWLRVARDQARTVSLRGLSPPNSSHAKAPAQETTITMKEVPELEAALLLVPDGKAWRVLLETPDITALTTHFPRFRTVLSTTRCAIGAVGKWQSRGWLLYGPYRVPLLTWPKSDEQLLRLENPEPTLEALFRADFLVRPGPTWLFKVGIDGMAREIRNLAVRAGERYIIVNTAGELPVEPPASTVNVHCAGIKAVIIDVPKALDQNTKAYLERLGMNVWQTIRIWPVGLSPAAWDGEGWAEWLVTDEILVGIASDNAIADIFVQLDSASSLRLNRQHSPALVALPHLEVGLHRLDVRMQTAGLNPAEQTGVLEFLIRAPRARVNAYKALFRVTVDPDRASLDDLWRGAVNIDVHGPSGRFVAPRIELAASTGGTVLAHKGLPSMSMPITAAGWKKVFRDHCEGDSALENQFDNANECWLHFEAGELGVTSVRFEHERRPLRWHAQRANNGFTLRLINEGIDDDTTSVDFYGYERPDHSTTMPGTQFVTPVTTPPSGLFLARNQKVEAGIVTPPAFVLKGLAGLGLNPQLRSRRPIPPDIEELIHMYERWASARIIHHALSFSFRHRVLTTLESAIGDLLYQETRVLGGAPSEVSLERLRNSISDPRVRALLPPLRAEVLNLTTSVRADWFARRLFPLLSYITTIPSPNVNDRPWMAEFTLRLASAPDTIAPWARGHLANALEFVLKHNTLMRVARYIVMSGDLAGGAKPLSASPLHDRWEWS